MSMSVSTLQDNFILNIVLEDYQYSSGASLYVKVSAENDNGDVISSPLYPVTLDENIRPGLFNRQYGGGTIITSWFELEQWNVISVSSGTVTKGSTDYTDYGTTPTNGMIIVPDDVTTLGAQCFDRLPLSNIYTVLVQSSTDGVATGKTWTFGNSKQGTDYNINVLYDGSSQTAPWGATFLNGQAQTYEIAAVELSLDSTDTSGGVLENIDDTCVINFLSYPNWNLADRYGNYTLQAYDESGNVINVSSYIQAQDSSFISNNKLTFKCIDVPSSSMTIKLGGVLTKYDAGGNVDTYTIPFSDAISIQLSDGSEPAPDPGPDPEPEPEPTVDNIAISSVSSNDFTLSNDVITPTRSLPLVGTGTITLVNSDESTDNAFATIGADSNKYATFEVVSATIDGGSQDGDPITVYTWNWTPELNAASNNMLDLIASNSNPLQLGMIDNLPLDASGVNVECKVTLYQNNSGGISREAKLQFYATYSGGLD